MSETASDGGTGVPDRLEQPKKKRARLACSCDRCRRRKIRCDERQPRCSNCENADVECTVSKPPKSQFIAPIRQKTGMKGESVAAQAAPISMPTQPATGPLNDVHNMPNIFPPAQASSHPPADISPSSSGTIAVYQGNGVSLSDAETLLHIHRVPTLNNDAQSTQTQPWQPGFGASPSSTLPTPDGTDPHPRVNDDGLLHADASEVRKFCGPSSSQVFLKWLDSESTGTKLARHLKFGASSSEEYSSVDLWGPRMPLPEPAKLKKYLDGYFEGVHPLLPLVDEAAVRQLAASPTPIDPLTMTLMQLIVSHGADSMTTSAEFSADGDKYLDEAYRALPTVLAKPYRTSCQIVILLCLGLRNRNKDGSAWTFAGLAVRLAQSLGLHHQHAGHNSSLDARIWFSCFVLDKILSFESGRPSAINDSACTVSPASIGEEALLRLPGRRPLHLFGALIGICSEMSYISTRLFTRGATKMSTIDALQIIGEADARLARWVEMLPVEMRPQLDGNITDPSLLRYTALIHVMYFHALITLHRLGLFDEVTAVKPHLDHPNLQPYMTRLRSSGATCTSAARATLSTLDRLSQSYPGDRSWTCHCLFTAILVLAIRVYKEPTTWAARADLFFLQSACDFASTRYRALNFHPNFIALLPRLYKKIEDKVSRPNLPSQPGTRSGSPTTTTNTTTMTATHSANRPSTADGLLASSPGPNSTLIQSIPGADAQLNEDRNNAPALDPNGFSELWSLLLGDGSSYDDMDGWQLGAQSDQQHHAGLAENPFSFGFGFDP